MFNSSATLLGDDECRNGTGVAGVAIENVDEGAASPSTPASSAGRLAPMLGTGAFAAVVAWRLL
jgi:hypothetical protein